MSNFNKEKSPAMSLYHIHPMLVHFPISLVIIGFLADLVLIIYKKELWLSKAGFYLLLTGTIAALFSLLSGTLFTSELSGEAGEIRETHELMAWITVAILVIASVFQILLNIRKADTRYFRIISLLLYGLGALSVSITGFYGGTLVYNYMMPL
jgi:uncharacterized membrane protein